MDQEEESLRRIVEEKLTLRLFVRDMGPLQWGEWLDELGESVAGKELANLILDSAGQVHFGRGFLRWRRVLRCVRRHPDLQRIVTERLEDHRMHTLRTVLSKRRIRTPATKTAEWKDIFTGLQDLMTGLGRTKPSEECDFWIVDDEVEETTHKIEICSTAGLLAFTPAVARDIQALLKDRRNDWAVLVALHIKNDPGFRWKRRGMLIRADQVEEHWDKILMRGYYGHGFPW